MVSSSNADVKSEKLPGAGERIPEDEGASVQSEEGMARSPPESPARGNAVESPSKKFQDFQDRRDIGGDGSPHATETQRYRGGFGPLFGVLFISSFLCFTDEQTICIMLLYSKV